LFQFADYSRSFPGVEVEEFAQWHWTRVYQYGLFELYVFVEVFAEIAGFGVYEDAGGCL
jgi:hypothetical protein